MKIAFYHQGSGYGGTDHQATLLHGALRKIGHEVVAFTEPTDLSRFNAVVIVHLNNIRTPKFYQSCKLYKKPYVVKTIWFPWKPGLFTYDVCRDASFLFAESPRERQILASVFPNIEHKTEVTLPAVDSIFTNKGKPAKDRPLVHVNGRYIKHKRALDVLRVCKDLKLPVCVSGFPQDQEYYRACMGVGYGEVLTEKDKPALCDILNESRLYVCASDMEVCSASVSEAIACGCNVLASEVYHPGNSNFTEEGYFLYDGTNLHEAMEKAYYSDAVQRNGFWTPEMLAEAYSNAFSKMVPKLL